MKKFFLLTASIISGIFALLNVFYPMIMTAYLTAKFTPEMEIKWNSASSIGIIGGADGLTAILVGDNLKSSLLRYGFASLFAIVSLVTAILSYKLSKEGKNQ